MTASVDLGLFLSPARDEGDPTSSRPARSARSRRTRLLMRTVRCVDAAWRPVSDAPMGPTAVGATDRAPAAGGFARERTSSVVVVAGVGRAAGGDRDSGRASASATPPISAATAAPQTQAPPRALPVGAGAVAESDAAPAPTF